MKTIVEIEWDNKGDLRVMPDYKYLLSVAGFTVTELPTQEGRCSDPEYNPKCDICKIKGDDGCYCPKDDGECSNFKPIPKGEVGK